MSDNAARDRFIQQRMQELQKGKKDALAGNKPSELSKAYIKGYEEGLTHRVEIIEPKWKE